MSVSNNFDDSQNDLSRSKNRMKRSFKEYPGKKVNINLYSEGNSSGSIDVNTSRGNIMNRSNEKFNAIAASGFTGNTT
jgi:hypothetical protein